MSAAIIWWMCTGIPRSFAPCIRSLGSRANAANVSTAEYVAVLVRGPSPLQAILWPAIHSALTSPMKCRSDDLLVGFLGEWSVLTRRTRLGKTCKQPIYRADQHVQCPGHDIYSSQSLNKNAPDVRRSTFFTDSRRLTGFRASYRRPARTRINRRPIRLMNRYVRCG